MKLPALALALSLGWTDMAPAQTHWFVDAGGTSPGSGTEGDPYVSIQFAIDQPATVAGDSIVVLPGTYTETVDLLGKSLMLLATQGPDFTIIDGGGSGSVVTVFDVPGAGVLVEGFTLTGGAGTDLGFGELRGGGIYCVDSELVLRDCVVERNTLPSGSTGLGHGLYVEASELTLIDCVVRENPLCTSPCFVGLFSSSKGGGLYCADSNTTILTSELTGNAAGTGGGVEASGGTLFIETSVIVGNRAVAKSGAGPLGGGGLKLAECDAELQRCEIADNDSDLDFRDGGGLLIAGGDVVIAQSTFSGNEGDQGGGAYVDSGKVWFEDCRFYENVARTFIAAVDTLGDGGGLWVSEVAAVTARNCVFAGNEALGFFGLEDRGLGGAVHGPAVLKNCTLEGNSALIEGGGAYGASLNSSIVRGNTPDQVDPTSTAIYCNVEGGFAGTGNIDAVPVYWAADFRNYHLRPGSLCIDAGDPSCPEDSDGSVTDMGAFPFDAAYCPPPAIYCTAKVNSQGCLPRIASSGSPSLSDPGSFVISASELLNGQFGILFYSFQATDAPFMGGTLCTEPELTPVRPVQSTGGSAPPDDCTGTLAVDFNAHIQGGTDGELIVGAAVFAQFWYRDPDDVFRLGLTDAMRFVVCP